MKNILIVGLACLVAALVFGVEPVQRAINEATYQGTLKGVETCMDYSRSELLSKEAVRATCVSTFQKRLYDNDHATGRAGPRMNQQTVGWGGILENRTADHVTTWVRISLSIFDADGNAQEISAETPIWIDPLGEAEFRVDLPELEPEQLENINFCEHESIAPKSCMTWGVVDMMGVAI
ncbi:hypothetical protein EF888_02290 [Silicimonas algicola]|uniref:Uncharacterized protein n=1 Tax=Silicimonas algicola TaxID=1826607 RepID=A0A316GBP7_9RHOB|nr:hypothetical protein [Silicimonas algicola]AZQ66054.1 hypothetical protein EF888_02290 [Silicimonas algicola]PWK58351.1 hypothetical protein C8D95_101164 [Silicimonas algicola]